jgi:hypothetical protein
MEPAENLTQPGFIQVSNREYHQSLGISKSDLTLFSITPAHYKAKEEYEETPVMAFGQAVHTAILEPSRFAKDYTVAPENTDRRTKAGKEWFAEAEQNGKKVLTQDQHNDLLGMKKSAYASKTARALLDAEGIIEHSGWWTDPRTGLLLKCRPDKVCTGLKLIVDLKTTTETGYDAFIRKVANYKYHWQGFHYLEGTRQVLDDNEYQTCLLIVVETKPPYAVSVYRMDEEMLYVASQEIPPLLIKFRECQEANQWPGYPDEVQTIQLPRWYVKRAME